MQTISTAFRFAIIMMLFSGLAYPLFITGLGQAFFPLQANGSLIKNKQGTAIASELIGQNFSKPGYFHPRPAANSYDASNSGGSNFGVTNKKLIERIRKDANGYQQENGVQTIPIDAVTTSASSLDPHITLANALNQVTRVAQARQVDSAQVKQLVEQVAEQPLLAEAPYVNVLRLNLALDRKLNHKIR